jgi:hypothetical protein
MKYGNKIHRIRWYTINYFRRILPLQINAKKVDAVYKNGSKGIRQGSYLNRELSTINNSNKINLGEFKVSRELANTKGTFFLMNNVYLRLTTAITQIDHILGTSNGLFVIETKDYNGTLTGNHVDNHWIVKASNGKLFTIDNPIFQNEIHVRAVGKALLNDKEVPIINIVAYVDRTINRTKGSKLLIPHTALNRFIKSATSNQISSEKLQYVEQILKHHDLGSHMEPYHIESIVEKQRVVVQSCPICASKLRLINKHSYLLSVCSTYPRCSYLNYVR